MDRLKAGSPPPPPTAQTPRPEYRQIRARCLFEGQALGSVITTVRVAAERDEVNAAAEAACEPAIARARRDVYLREQADSVKQNP
jgi:hypothetical protein